jgi:hypothetical protein
VNIGPSELLILFLLFGGLVVGGGVGYLIGKTRGRGGLGFVLGFLLSWVGWIIVLLLGRTPEAEALHDVEVAEAARRLRAG